MALASYNTYPIGFVLLRDKKNMVAVPGFKHILFIIDELFDSTQTCWRHCTFFFYSADKEAAECNWKGEAEDGGEADLSPMQEVF